MTNLLEERPKIFKCHPKSIVQQPFTLVNKGLDHLLPDSHKARFPTVS